MTNSELIKKLQALPADMEVMLYQTNDESAYGITETVAVEEVTFGSDDVPKKKWAKENCIVISDEI